MQETRVSSLGQEDPLEKEMATHCSILAWETEEPGRLLSMGKELDTTYQINHHHLRDVTSSNLFILSFASQPIPRGVDILTGQDE